VDAVVSAEKRKIYYGDSGIWIVIAVFGTVGIYAAHKFKNVKVLPPAEYDSRHQLAVTVGSVPAPTMLGVLIVLAFLVVTYALFILIINWREEL
jgi:UDP-N-acetylmuramyl pentapeptide phosphotransferase/UDP-N-acetylglucosamine-1-phosphate transferase